MLQSKTGTPHGVVAVQTSVIGRCHINRMTTVCFCSVHLLGKSRSLGTVISYRGWLMWSQAGHCNVQPVTDIITGHASYTLDNVQVQ